mgnify:CR=1 FL=1
MVWLQQLHSLNNCQVPPKSLKGFQVEWTLFSIDKQDLKSPKVAFNAFNSWDKLLVQSISSLTHLQFSWFLHNFLAKCFQMLDFQRILELLVHWEYGSAHVKESAVITDSLEMHSNEIQRFPVALTFWAESLDFIIWIPENSKLTHLRIPGKGVKSLDLWIPYSLGFIPPKIGLIIGYSSIWSYNLLVVRYLLCRKSWILICGHYDFFQVKVTPKNPLFMLWTLETRVN